MTPIEADAEQTTEPLEITLEDVYHLLAAVHQEVSYMADLLRKAQAGIPAVAAELEAIKIPSFLPGGSAKGSVLNFLGGLQ